MGSKAAPSIRVGPALRALAAPELLIDLKPANTVEQLVAKLGPIRRNFLAEAGTRWRLSDAARAVLACCAHDGPAASAESLAHTAKHCRLRLSGPRPLAEAISSAGGGPVE